MGGGGRIGEGIGGPRPEDEEGGGGREMRGGAELQLYRYTLPPALLRVQELCESRGGRPGLPVLMSLTVSVDVKQH